MGKRNSGKSRRVGSLRKQAGNQAEHISYETLFKNRKNANNAQKYHVELFHELQAQRHFNRDSIRLALSSKKGITLSVNNWTRIVEYRYSFEPLSLKGSAQLVGGRFNIGRDVNPNQAHWHALYIAETEGTAFNEKYPQPTQTGHNEPLTQKELNLITHENSYSVIKLNGKINNIFELGNPKFTKEFIDIVSKFKVRKSTQDLAKKAGIVPWTLLHNHESLVNMCMQLNWRTIPYLFDIPSTPQVFGGLIRDAGFSGILYPSSKSTDNCLVLFPDNFDDKSKVVIKDPPKKLKLNEINNINWEQHT